MQGEIEAALSDHFGRPVGLVLVVDDGTVSAAPRGRSARVLVRSPGPAAGPPAARNGGDGAWRSRPGRGRRTDRRGWLDDETDDLSVFDESELGEVADIDNSAEARVLQAFPGAEEVG